MMAQIKHKHIRPKSITIDPAIRYSDSKAITINPAISDELRYITSWYNHISVPVLMCNIIEEREWRLMLMLMQF